MNNHDEVRSAKHTAMLKVSEVFLGIPAAVLAGFMAGVIWGGKIPGSHLMHYYVYSFAAFGFMLSILVIRFLRKELGRMEIIGVVIGTIAGYGLLILTYTQEFVKEPIGALLKALHTLLPIPIVFVGYPILCYTIGISATMFILQRYARHVKGDKALDQ